MAGQFDFQASSSPLLAALTQVPQRQQEARLADEQAKRERLNSLLNNMQQFATMGRTIQQGKQAALEQQQTESQMAGQQQLQDLLGQQSAQQARPVSSFSFGPNAQQPTFGQTPQGTVEAQMQQPQIQAALLKADPGAASQLAKQQFESPDDKALKDAKLLNYGSLIQNRGKGRTSSISITYDGKPMLADRDPNTRTYYKAGTDEVLNGNEIGPGNLLSPIAEQRRQNLIGTLNDRMDKKMNPANWGSNTVAGKSAQLVANADSGINLADQMLTGKIPTTSQTFTSLALDANRVLTQTGVVSEKTTQELKAKTGFASIAAGIQYLTAHPTDQKLQPFVQILKTEMERQRDQRQSIVNRTLSSELSSLNQLKRLSPQDWEDQITGKGFDLEAAKKGNLKIRPEVGSSLYEWDTNPAGTPAPAGKLSPQDEAAQFLKGL